jgi:hypothetical protein
MAAPLFHGNTMNFRGREAAVSDLVAGWLAGAEPGIGAPRRAAAIDGRAESR